MKTMYDYVVRAVTVSGLILICTLVPAGVEGSIIGGILGFALSIFVWVQIYRFGVRQTSTEDLDIKLRAFDRNVWKLRSQVNEAGAEWLNVISAEKAQVIQKMAASAFGGKSELEEFLQLYDALENMPDRYFKREMDEKEAGLAARADEKLKELKELKERYGMAEDVYLSRSNAVMEEWARGLASYNKMNGNYLSRDIQWKDGEEFGTREIVGLADDKERVARRHRFEIKEFYASAKLNNVPALDRDEFYQAPTYWSLFIAAVGGVLGLMSLWFTDDGTCMWFTLISTWLITGFVVHPHFRDRMFRARIDEDREQRKAVRSRRGINPLGIDYLDAIDEEMESLQSRLSAKEISVNEFCSKYAQMQAWAVNLPEVCFDSIFYTEEGLQRRMAAEEAKKAEKAKSGKAIDEKMAEAIKSEILSGPISGRLPSDDEERESAQRLTEALEKSAKWTRDHPAARC